MKTLADLTVDEVYEGATGFSKGYMAAERYKARPEHSAAADLEALLLEGLTQVGEVFGITAGPELGPDEVIVKTGDTGFADTGELSTEGTLVVEGGEVHMSFIPQVGITYNRNSIQIVSGEVSVLGIINVEQGNVTTAEFHKADTGIVPNGVELRAQTKSLSVPGKAFVFEGKTTCVLDGGIGLIEDGDEFTVMDSTNMPAVEIVASVNANGAISFRLKADGGES